MTRLARILFVGLFVGWQGVPDDKADAYVVCRVARST